jgi:hypothetical protein
MCATVDKETQYLNKRQLLLLLSLKFEMSESRPRLPSNVCSHVCRNFGIGQIAPTANTIG